MCVYSFALTYYVHTIHVYSCSIMCYVDNLKTMH